jgi:tetratricopeptide (TPR) repeat protein
MSTAWTSPRPLALRAAVVCALLAVLLAGLLVVAGPAAAARSHPYNLGCRALAKGDLAEATRLFKLAVKLEPDDTDALNNLAVCYLQSGEFAKADALLEKVLQLNAKYRGADLNIGAGFILRGDPAGGEESTQKATDAPSTPNGKAVEASAYYNLGLIEAAAGDYVQAQADLEKSAAMSPSARTDAALGVVQCAQGDYDAGIVTLQRVQDSVGSDQTADGGGPDQALADAATGNLAAAHYQRGMDALERGDTAAAKTDFTRSRDLRQNDYAKMGLALVAAEQGDTAGAEKTLTALKSSQAPGVAAAAAANLAEVRKMGDGGGGTGGSDDDWLSWLVLIGGGVLFAAQTFAVLRAAATRPRGPLALPLAGLGAVMGVVTAAVFALSYFGTLDGSTFVLAALAVDVVIVVLTLAAPSLGHRRAGTA